MIYKHKKSGVVINVASPITSPDWIEIRKPKVESKKPDLKTQSGEQKAGFKNPKWRAKSRKGKEQ